MNTESQDRKAIRQRFRINEKHLQHVVEQTAREIAPRMSTEELEANLRVACIQENRQGILTFKRALALKRTSV